LLNEGIIHRYLYQLTSFGQERLFGWYAELRGLDNIALSHWNLKLFNTVKQAIRNVPEGF